MKWYFLVYLSAEYCYMYKYEIVNDSELLI